MARLNRKDLNRLWELYQSEHRINVLARLTKIHHLTVRRYVERGDPKNGIEAFVNRMKKVTDKQDFDRAAEQVKDLEMISTVIRAAGRDLFRVEQRNGRDVIVGLKNDPTLLDMDKLLRLKYFLAGEPDSRSEIRVNAEASRVVQAVIAAVSKYVSDQKTRNLIADELIRIINSGESERGFTKPPLSH